MMTEYLDSRRLAGRFGLPWPEDVRGLLERACLDRFMVRVEPNPTRCVNIDTWYVKSVADCDGRCSLVVCAAVVHLTDSFGWSSLSHSNVHVPATSQVEVAP